MTKASRKLKKTWNHLTRTISCLVLASALVPASARSDELSGSMTLYGWLPWIDQTLTAHSGGGDFKTSTSPSDVLDALKFAFMAAGEVHYGRIGLLHDTIYSSLGGGGKTSGPLSASVDVDVEMLLATTALGYQVYVKDGALIEPYAGSGMSTSRRTSPSRGAGRLR